MLDFCAGDDPVGRLAIHFLEQQPLRQEDVSLSDRIDGQGRFGLHKQFVVLQEGKHEHVLNSLEESPALLARRLQEAKDEVVAELQIKERRWEADVCTPSDTHQTIRQVDAVLIEPEADDADEESKTHAEHRNRLDAGVIIGAVAADHNNRRHDQDHLREGCDLLGHVVIVIVEWLCNQTEGNYNHNQQNDNNLLKHLHAGREGEGNHERKHGLAENLSNFPEPDVRSEACIQESVHAHHALIGEAGCRDVFQEDLGEHHGQKNRVQDDAHEGDHRVSPPLSRIALEIGRDEKKR
mmetsp:Transcript_66122/g.181259  ORF Transcript_66122/g.181259 Transcript_66122/m.181259 type:complete len:295 (-) Transcript_66122:3569-4453(-)